MKLINARCKTLALAIPIALSGAATTLAPVANADTAIYSGTVCQSWGGNARSEHDLVEYSQFGRVLNDHSVKRLGVVCPIPRDNRVQNPINKVIVYYTDRHPGAGSVGTLSCRLRTNGVYGDAALRSTRRTTAAGKTAKGAWSFDNLPITKPPVGPGPHFAPSVNDSNYTLFCQLPPKYAGRDSSVGSIVVIN